MVKVAPEFEQPPPFENVTEPPRAVAATPNEVPKTAVPGACVVTVIVWSAFCAVSDSVTSGAALQLRLPARSYLTWQAVVPLVIVKVAPECEQPPLFEKVTGLP